MHAAAGGEQPVEQPRRPLGDGSGRRRVALPGLCPRGASWAPRGRQSRCAAAPSPPPRRYLSLRSLVCHPLSRRSLCSQVTPRARRHRQSSSARRAACRRPPSPPPAPPPAAQLAAKAAGARCARCAHARAQPCVSRRRGVLVCECVRLRALCACAGPAASQRRRPASSRVRGCPVGAVNRACACVAAGCRDRAFAR